MFILNTRKCHVKITRTRFCKSSWQSMIFPQVVIVFPNILSLIKLRCSELLYREYLICAKTKAQAVMQDCKNKSSTEILILRVPTASLHMLKSVSQWFSNFLSLWAPVSAHKTTARTPSFFGLKNLIWTLLSVSNSTGPPISKSKASRCRQLPSPKSNERSVISQYEHVRLHTWCDEAE